MPAPSFHRLGLVAKLAAPVLLTSTVLVACAAADVDVPEVADHHDHGDEGSEENLGTSASALVASDPVSAAVTGSCNSGVVEGLAKQLVAEVECLRPNTMRRVDNIPGIRLGTAASKVPYLQKSAADALVRVQKARGVTLEVNSALRALPQQYILYRWYQLGRCGISLAARPGTSNHESGIAVDVNDNAAWRTAMSNNSYRWLGARDPVHYDYVGGGSVALTGLSVRAFQRLWNRNHANDKIAEDGSYGPETEKRLMMSPIGGFPKGALASCQATPADAGPADATPKDGGADAADEEPEEPPMVPDAPEPDEEGDGALQRGPLRDSSAEESEGCTVGPLGARHSRGVASGAALGLALALGLAARRRGRSER